MKSADQQAIFDAAENITRLQLQLESMDPNSFSYEQLFDLFVQARVHYMSVAGHSWCNRPEILG